MILELSNYKGAAPLLIFSCYPRLLEIAFSKVAQLCCDETRRRKQGDIPDNRQPLHMCETIHSPVWVRLLRQSILSTPTPLIQNALDHLLQEIHAHWLSCLDHPTRHRLSKTVLYCWWVMHSIRALKAVRRCKPAMMRRAACTLSSNSRSWAFD